MGGGQPARCATPRSRRRDRPHRRACRPHRRAQRPGARRRRSSRARSCAPTSWSRRRIRRSRSCEQIDRAELPDDFVERDRALEVAQRHGEGQRRRRSAARSSPRSPASIPKCTAARSCSPSRSTTSRARSRTRSRAGPPRSRSPTSASRRVFDPTLAPEGKHIVSMFTQWVPHTWASEPDPAELDAYADRVIARVDAVAPGFADSILHRQVIGPYEMEHEYGLIGGNIFHGELSPDQLFHMRPAPGLRRLPHADRRALPGEQRDARRRRRDRHPRAERDAADHARPCATSVAACVRPSPCSARSYSASACLR